MLETVENFLDILFKVLAFAMNFNYNFYLKSIDMISNSINFLAEKLESIESCVIQTTELVFRLLNFLPQLIIVPYEFFHSKEQKSKHTELSQGVRHQHKEMDPIVLLFLVSLCFLLFFILILTCYYKHKIYMLKLRNDQLEKNQIVYMCCICRYDTSSVLLMPCKHLCVCLRCFYMLKKNDSQYNSRENDQNTQRNCCPMCRTQIVDSIRVYAWKRKDREFFFLLYNVIYCCYLNKIQKSFHGFMLQMCKI